MPTSHSNVPSRFNHLHAARHLGNARGYGVPMTTTTNDASAAANDDAFDSYLDDMQEAFDVGMLRSRPRPTRTRYVVSD